MAQISKIAQDVFEIWFPQFVTCYFCEEELPPDADMPLCLNCQSDIKWIEPPFCSVCGRTIEKLDTQYKDYFYKCKECQEQFVYYERHRAIAHYDEGVKKGLMGLKYKKQKYQARYFAEKMAEMIRLDENLSNFDYIVPVPVHVIRKISRGYNQSELLANRMARVLGKKVIPDLLLRKMATKKLKKLGRVSRKKMLEDAIIVNKRKQALLKEKKILLVDDIYTTGATLNACSRALYEAGCEKIICVTVARG